MRVSTYFSCEQFVELGLSHPFKKDIVCTRWLVGDRYNSWSHEELVTPPAQRQVSRRPSRFCNPVLRGWINYYGQYYKSAPYPIFEVFNGILVQCMRREYRRFRFYMRRATRWLRQIARRQLWLFAHWKAGFQP